MAHRDDPDDPTLLLPVPRAGSVSAKSETSAKMERLLQNQLAHESTMSEPDPDEDRGFDFDETDEGFDFDKTAPAPAPAPAAVQKPGPPDDLFGDSFKCCVCTMFSAKKPKGRVASAVEMYGHPLAKEDRAVGLDGKPYAKTALEQGALM